MTSPFAGWAEHAKRELGRSGFRSGRARAAVIDLLALQECCLTAQEIFDGLRASGQTVGIATVYRVLDQLTQQRLLQRLEFGEAARYEPILPSGEHHHHVLCGDCGRVEPFADSPLERELDRLGDQLGYELEGHDVVLRGFCGDCRTDS
ncbi:MAG: transcriptional repressor [Gaiellaceae bacterium MAG52_C11]|nr:transcriptional repressor [Candidatus Gaiellasilicea maunaloa]